MSFNKEEKRLLDQIAGSKVGSDLLEEKINEGGSSSILDQDNGLTIYETDTWAFNEGAPPARDPKGRQGWYYSKQAAPNHYFSWRGIDNDSPTLAEDIFQLSDIVSGYCIFSVDSTMDEDADYQFLQYYTLPKGDAGDAAAWYRSRVAWVWPVALPAPIPGQKYLVFFGSDPGVHLELPRIQLEPGASTVGPQDPDEQVWRYGANVATNSTSETKILIDTFGISAGSVEKEWMLDWTDNQVITVRDIKRLIRNTE